MKSLLLSIVAICLSILPIRSSETWLDNTRTNLELGATTDEVFYLPKTEAVQVMSAGYQGTWSDVLWFYGTAYFGRHYRQDGKYQWLYQYCDLVTTLDPYKVYAYRFCALMLAWEGDAPELAVKLLDRGVENLPEEWLMLYYRGFVKFYFLQDNKGAVSDFAAACKLPGVDPTLVGMTEKLGKKEFGAEQTIKVLEGLLASTSDPVMRDAINKRISNLSS